MPGVYISYPFCAQKCTYCNFASGVFGEALEARYLAALCAEIERHRWEWLPETVYIGGGTPSQMEPAALGSLCGRVPGRPWAEATLEAAPGTVTADKALIWRGCGINRVSLGVQSFVEREIRAAGRKHTAQTVADDVATLRASGIGAVNIDLIAGLAWQTEASWRESLCWIERIAPEHVSVYMLEVDGDSRLGREILLGGKRYGAESAPSESMAADLYEYAAERLASLGIERYEISNFARPGFESRHNLKYGRRERYVGFGADAHSFDGEARRGNAESLEDFVRSQGGTAEATNAAEEKFFLGLRLREGVPLAAEDWARFEAPIRRFAGEGLLEINGENLRLTPRGILLSNEVFQEFLL